MSGANNVQQLRWPAQSLDLNHIDQLLDQLKHKVRACVRPFLNCSHRHIISTSSRYLAVDATPNGCTRY